MERSIDERVKNIMALKKIVGEFSLDLYYNDLDKENPYTAKVHSAVESVPTFYARGKSFGEALGIVEEHFDIK